MRLRNAIILVLLAIIFIGGYVFYDFISSYFKSSTPPRVYKIGIIRYLKIYDPEVDGFKGEMEKMGYKEGVNVTYYRFDVDKVADVNVAAKELIQKNVDLIFAVTTVAAKGTLDETVSANRTDIPIVFAQGNLAVRAGLVKSLQSSGNNATGVAVDFVQLTAKKLEFLKMVNPNIKKLGYFDAAHSDPAATFNLEELKIQAPKFGITLVPYLHKNPVGPAATEELKNILKNIKPGEIDAYFHLPGPIMGFPNQPTIIEGLNRLKIPGVWLELPTVGIGGLFAYSQDLADLGRQAAFIAGRVLKGTRPADIPVELPRKYFLVVNLKTAREIGITLPQSFLDLASVKIGQ